jgi:dihydrofolate reductase
LKDAEKRLVWKWNYERLVKKNVAEKLKKLKQQQGRDMTMIDSARIVQIFMNLGLIDEYRLLVHPVVLGSRKPLFKKLKAVRHAKIPISWKAS